MKRTAINPSQWGLNFQFNQAELVEETTRTLYVSGQVALKDDPSSPLGMSVEHPGDLAGQLKVTLANIDAVLAGAGMQRQNIVHVRLYTTDIDGFLENYGIYAEWISEAGIKPANTLLGVARLAMADMMVEIEITAVG